MNWEMLSAIGQVVAAIGVIPSLIYLAVQIREQNKERRRAGINILTAQWSDLVKTGQENREFAALFYEVCAPSKVLMHRTSSASARFSLDIPETVRACSFTIVTVRWRKRSGMKSNEP
jgi:heme/copper-type cytochrome/quinol oxidase subunit 1